MPAAIEDLARLLSRTMTDAGWHKFIHGAFHGIRNSFCNEGLVVVQFRCEIIAALPQQRPGGMRMRGRHHQLGSLHTRRGLDLTGRLFVDRAHNAEHITHDKGHAGRAIIQDQTLRP